MEKVLIEVIGTQNIDSQFDKTELKTVGTFEELEEKYIIRYKEEPVSYTHLTLPTKLEV